MKHARILALLAFGAATLAAQTVAAQQQQQQATQQHRTTGHKATARKADSQAALRAEAKISERAARATALAQVPGGAVQSNELEREGGKLVYSYDIKVAGKSGIEEVLVDAMTGTVVKHEHETPAMEKKEKKAEAKEQAKKGKGGAER